MISGALRIAGLGLLAIAASAASQAVDPLAPYSGQIGVQRAAFKQAFPSKKVTPFGADCPVEVKAYHKGDAVDRLSLWSNPPGAGCVDRAIEALTTAYGAPGKGGYGYATVIAPAVIRHSVETFTWCRADQDVILARAAGQSGRFTLYMSRPGAYDPGSGKAVEPGSPEHRKRCAGEG